MNVIEIFDYSGMVAGFFALGHHDLQAFKEASEEVALKVADGLDLGVTVELSGEPRHTKAVFHDHEGLELDPNDPETFEGEWYISVLLDGSGLRSIQHDVTIVSAEEVEDNE